MKIRRFEAEALHGYLSFDIDFDDSLTFLIGINGSGKTSAVRAVMALITPALRDIARLEFSRLAVTVAHDGFTSTIIATRDEDEVHIQVVGIDVLLVVPGFPRPNYESRAVWEERELEHYRDLEVLNARHPVIEHLSSLPTPMFLDLERRAQVGVSRRGTALRGIGRDHISSPTLLSGTLLESLRDAQTLAEAAYRRNLAQQRELADRLKKDLILTHFKTFDAEWRLALELPSRSEMRRLQTRQALVNSSLAAMGIGEEEIRETVDGFFTTVYSVVNSLRRKDLHKVLASGGTDIQQLYQWFALEPQLRRVEKVLEQVESYSSQLEYAERGIQRYLQLVNQFLVDSGKELYFLPTGDLRVLMHGTNSWRPISALSSGERQLVVILTHLSFNDAARRANVLIIDEPELSLHIRWQEQFVDALQGASEDLQLILATHSPSIVMQRDSNCVDILEARK